ncbi:MAG: cell division protein FtsQ/DivIB [Endomicrobia bacterium]|nr:cell division protein FtsQ/DivIB [Endomicrobiia bacterium]
MSKRKKYSYRKRVSFAGTYPRSYSKRRKLGKPIVYFILLCALAFLLHEGYKRAVSYAYAADSMTIKDIEVAGCKNVTGTEIKELLPFKIGDNLLKIDLSQSETEIMKVKPELKDISISRRWQKVRVKLYERTPEAFVMYGKELYGIDFDNKPFPLRGFMSGMKIPAIVYNTYAERAALLDFIKKFKPVSEDFLDNISEIKFSNSGDIVLTAHDGTVIFWGDERPEYMQHKFEKFKKIYVDAAARYKHLEYIDMTLYGLGRAVVKPQQQSQN